MKKSLSLPIILSLCLISMLKQALDIDPGIRPEWKLENLVMQRRARWLLSRIDQLFVEEEDHAERN